MSQMAQPINPNTNIPMSLQVERLQQMRNVLSTQQQGQLAQQSAIEEKVQGQRVNSNQESDQVQIRDKEEGKKEQKHSGKEQKGKKENRSDEEIEEKSPTISKGRFVDIKV